MLKIAIFSRPNIVDKAVLFYDGGIAGSLGEAKEEAETMLDGHEPVVLDATADVDPDKVGTDFYYSTIRAFIG